MFHSQNIYEKLALYFRDICQIVYKISVNQFSQQLISVPLTLNFCSQSMKYTKLKKKKFYFFSLSLKKKFAWPLLGIEKDHDKVFFINYICNIGCRLDHKLFPGVYLEKCTFHLVV